MSFEIRSLKRSLSLIFPKGRCSEFFAVLRNHGLAARLLSPIPPNFHRRDLGITCHSRPTAGLESALKAPSNPLGHGKGNYPDFTLDKESRRLLRPRTRYQVAKELLLLYGFLSIFPWIYVDFSQLFFNPLLGFY